MLLIVKLKKLVTLATILGPVYSQLTISKYFLSTHDTITSNVWNSNVLLVTLAFSTYTVTKVLVMLIDRILNHERT